MIDLAGDIEKLRKEQNDHKEGAEQTEQQIVALLWDARGEVTVERMCELTGWSRQTIYNKWKRCGYSIPTPF